MTREDLIRWAATTCPAAPPEWVDRLLSLAWSAVAGPYAPPPTRPADPTSEAGVTAAVRVEAAKRGMLLFRNNVGACRDETGRMIRYGLANDSAPMNKQFKSADWIGVAPVVVTVEMVGRTFGQFVSLEVKRANWCYTGTEREQGQKRWAELIRSRGGRAQFINHEDQLDYERTD